MGTRRRIAAFPPAALVFLTELWKHNQRRWFQPRKHIYEESVKVPMIEAIHRIGEAFRRFAPEMVADPKISLYRVYRDTRFSPDKLPYKDSRRGGISGSGIAEELRPGPVLSYLARGGPDRRRHVYARGRRVAGRAGAHRCCAPRVYCHRGIAAISESIRRTGRRAIEDDAKGVLGGSPGGPVSASQAILIRESVCGESGDQPAIFPNGVGLLSERDAANPVSRQSGGESYLGLR